MTMGKTILSVSFSILVLGGLGLAELSQTDEQLLQGADRARFLEADFYTLTIRVTVERPAKEPDQALLKVFCKRFGEDEGYRVRIEFLEPGTLRGMVYLVVGDGIYFWKPGLIQLLRVSGQQRLFGDASVFEAVGLRFVGYKIIGREPDTLEGQEALRLELEAAGPVAYQRVTLWINPKGKPLQAVLRSLGGEPLKRVSYRRYAEYTGDEQVVEQVIENLLFEKYRTTIVVEEVLLEALPDKFFDPEALGAEG